MHLVVVALVGLVVSSVEAARLRSYHEEYGIPLAAKIKESEEQMMSSNARIIGGVMANVNAHPHFAGLLVDIFNPPVQSVCGSTLLTHSRLVTAAHCWTHGQVQAWRFTVVLGTPFLYSGGVRVASNTVAVHPHYVWQNLANDVAVIYLHTPISFSVHIQPAALPSYNDFGKSFENEWATAVGFGATRDNQGGGSPFLSFVYLQVIPSDQCRAVFGSANVLHSTLCTSGTGRVGICSGDSGGPLTTWRNGRNTLIGIASFAADHACEWGFPSGFSRVTSFMNFIVPHL